MKLSEILPVLISIGIILLIATLQRYSRVIAGITATMPVTIPLSLWIVYSASRGERAAIETYTRSMAIGILATVVFTVALWLAARAGMKLGWMVTLAYGAWIGAVVVSLFVKRWLGV
ncbi:MAG: hypothetical protein ACKOC5_19725 [Chloroflexota bacterium]